MNVRLLEEIARDFEKEPQKARMAVFVTGGQQGVDLTTRRPDLCGTTCCIAGDAILKTQKKILLFSPQGSAFAMFNNKAEMRARLAPLERPWWQYPDFTTYSTEEEATKVLGLTCSQAARLFFEAYWPEKYREDLLDAREKGIGEGKVVADYIRFFIKQEAKGQS